MYLENHPVVSYFRLPKSNPCFSFSWLVLFPRYTRDSQSHITLNRCIHSSMLTPSHPPDPYSLHPYHWLPWQHPFHPTCPACQQHWQKHQLLCPPSLLPLKLWTHPYPPSQPNSTRLSFPSPSSTLQQPGTTIFAHRECKSLVHYTTRRRSRRAGRPRRSQRSTGFHQRSSGSRRCVH